MNKDERDALEAMQAAIPSFLAAGVTVDEHGMLSPDEEHLVRVALVHQVKPMLEKLRTTDDDLFRIAKDRDGVLWVKANRLGGWFLRCLRSEVTDIFEMFPLSKFNPYFEAFTTGVNRYDLMLGEFHIRTASGQGIPSLVDRQPLRG